MRHSVYGRHLGRNIKTRRQLFKNLVVSLISHGRITTTLAKAKAVQPFLERLVTYAKNKNLGIKRLALSKLGNDRKSWEILVKTVAETFKETNGGYTRVIKVGQRHGDKAAAVILEWSKKVEAKVSPKIDNDIKAGGEQVNKTRATQKRIVKRDTE